MTSNNPAAPLMTIDENRIIASIADIHTAEIIRRSGAKRKICEKISYIDANGNVWHARQHDDHGQVVKRFSGSLFEWFDPIVHIQLDFHYVESVTLDQIRTLVLDILEHHRISPDLWQERVDFDEWVISIREAKTIREIIELLAS